MRYMRGLNEWLERDVYDRQNELRGVVARVDQLRDELRTMQPSGMLTSLHLTVPSNNLMCRLVVFLRIAGRSDQSPISNNPRHASATVPFDLPTNRVSSIPAARYPSATRRYAHASNASACYSSTGRTAYHGHSASGSHDAPNARNGRLSYAATSWNCSELCANTPSITN
jgi:hypothetical protein